MPTDHAITRSTDCRAVHMIRRRDSDDYRQAPLSEVRDRQARGAIVLEGVDGDEAANTVTYWHMPTPPES